MESEFGKQFAGSTSANLVTILVLSLLWIMKKKCNHSKCKMHNSCIDIEVSKSDDSENVSGQAKNRL